MTDRELLNRYGHHLTADQHEAFDLYCVRKFSQYEVADRLNITREAVRDRIRRARKNLDNAQRKEAA